jgi:hypothetical protein
MTHRLSLPTLLTMLVFGGAAHGQAAEPAKAATQVNVYEFAVSNPVNDSRLRMAPTLGETVPEAIVLVPLDGEASYAYFYYNGRPVIVDLTTRSVVRVGQ